jgi:hypothetical protein
MSRVPGGAAPGKNTNSSQWDTGATAHQFSSSPEGRRAHTSMKLCDACQKKGRAMLA